MGKWVWRSGGSNDVERRTGMRRRAGRKTNKGPAEVSQLVPWMLGVHAAAN